MIGGRELVHHAVHRVCGLLRILEHGDVIRVDGGGVVEVDGHVHVHGRRGQVHVVGSHVHAHSGAGEGYVLLGERELAWPLLGRARLGLIRVHASRYLRLDPSRGSAIRTRLGTRM